MGCETLGCLFVVFLGMVKFYKWLTKNSGNGSGLRNYTNIKDESSLDVMGPVRPFIDSAPQPATTQGYKYQRRSLLTEAEKTFCKALTAAVAGRGMIMCKVRLLDIIQPTTRDYTPLNKVMRKHIDFMIYSPTGDYLPLLAVELDDSSHQRFERQERDAFVDEALQSANIPILHVPWQSSYNVDTLRASVDQKIWTIHQVN